MYNIKRQCTTYYVTLYDNVRQCSTKNTSLRQYFCRTQKFYMEYFFSINRSTTYKNLSLTSNNHDSPRQPNALIVLFLKLELDVSILKIDKFAVTPVQLIAAEYVTNIARKIASQ